MSHDVEKPRSKSTDLCPHFKKQMRSVCHKCAFWEHIKGRHPQTGESIERWGCILVHDFLLKLENNKVTYEQGAAIESLRNELVEHQRMALRVAAGGNHEATQYIEAEFTRLDQIAEKRTQLHQLQSPETRNVHTISTPEIREAAETVEPTARRKTSGGTQKTKTTRRR